MRYRPRSIQRLKICYRRFTEAEAGEECEKQVGRSLMRSPLLIALELVSSTEFQKRTLNLHQNVRRQGYLRTGVKPRHTEQGLVEFSIKQGRGRGEAYYLCPVVFTQICHLAGIYLPEVKRGIWGEMGNHCILREWRIESSAETHTCTRSSH